MKSSFTSSPFFLGTLLPLFLAERTPKQIMGIREIHDFLMKAYDHDKVTIMNNLKTWGARARKRHNPISPEEVQKLLKKFPLEIKVKKESPKKEKPLKVVQEEIIKESIPPYPKEEKCISKEKKRLMEAKKELDNAPPSSLDLPIIDQEVILSTSASNKIYTEGSKMIDSVYKDIADINHYFAMTAEESKGLMISLKEVTENQIQLYDELENCDIASDADDLKRRIEILGKKEKILRTRLGDFGKYYREVWTAKSQATLAASQNLESFVNIIGKVVETNERMKETGAVKESPKETFKNIDEMNEMAQDTMKDIDNPRFKQFLETIK